jgi:1,2-diacylglycerol 3-alpha-glucosyltransferase
VNPRPVESQAPVRVALISSGLGHVLRGVESWMQDLAVHLPRDLDVELWAGGRLRNPPSDRPFRRLHSVSREVRAARPLHWDRRYQLEQITAFPLAMWWLKRRRIHVAYTGDPFLGFHLKRWRRWHGAKMVFMNGMRLTPVWLQDFDGVHLLAPPYLEEARRLVPGRADQFFAIPHFTDTERIRPASIEGKRAARRALGLPETQFLVATIGPVGTFSGKRLDVLAREVALAPGVALVSAGGDEDGAAAVRSAAAAALGDRMHFLGRLDRSRIPSLLAAADAYSLGSLAEPFSIAILEAMASGLPVVHHPDEVMRWQTGEGGVPARMDAPGEAGAVFRRLSTSPGEAAGIGAKARALAEVRYAPQAVCRALADALRKLALSGKP